MGDVRDLPWQVCMVGADGPGLFQCTPPGDQVLTDKRKAIISIISEVEAVQQEETWLSSYEADDNRYKVSPGYTGGREWSGGQLGFSGAVVVQGGLLIGSSPASPHSCSFLHISCHACTNALHAAEKAACKNAHSGHNCK